MARSLSVTDRFGKFRISERSSDEKLNSAFRFLFASVFTALMILSLNKKGAARRKRKRTPMTMRIHLRAFFISRKVVRYLLFIINENLSPSLREQREVKKRKSGMSYCATNDQPTPTQPWLRRWAQHAELRKDRASR